jgi:pyruvate kinase
VTYARPELPAITEKDIADLALAAECGADFVALSFARGRCTRLRRLPTGARVILTAGRQTGTPGATNLIMVREIP